MTAPKPCAFCAIGSGAPATIVFEDANTLVFLDTNPVFKGHALVVPRVHVDTLLDLPTAALASYFGVVQRVAAAMRDGLGADGSFVAQNNVVSQSVPHLHTHVVPRHRKDGLRGFFWPRVKYASDGERDAYAEKIRAAMG